VFRGGYWGFRSGGASLCRSAFSSGNYPDCGDESDGFRVVLAPVSREQKGVRQGRGAETLFDACE